MGERTDEVTQNSGGSRTDSIRRDIDRTQHEIERTIDSLRYRLSPEHIMSETKQSIRRAGVNTSRSLVDRVKANPLPTAMVGVGLWLLFRNTNEHTAAFESDSFYDRYGYDRDAYDRGYGSPYRYGTPGHAGIEYASDEGITERVSGRVSSAKDQVSDRVSSVKDEMSDRVDETRERVSSAVEHGRERLSDLSEDARERAWQLRERASMRMRQSRSAARDMFFDNPLAIGAAAIALGAIIGAAIPETEREAELMGSARDRIADQAKSIAREKMDQAKDVASAAATAAKDAAKNEAQSSGLTETPRSGSRTDISGSGLGMGTASEHRSGSPTGGGLSGSTSGTGSSSGIGGSGIGSSGTTGSRSTSPTTRSGSTGTSRSDDVINPPGSIDPNRRR